MIYFRCLLIVLLSAIGVARAGSVFQQGKDDTLTTGYFDPKISSEIWNLNFKNLQLKNGHSYKFEKRFEKMTEKGAPGLSLMLIKGGKIVYQKSFGYAQLGQTPVQISTTSNFNMASISKQFTAYAIMLLEEQNVLSANDLVQKWLPELPAYGSKIQISDLIHHTSGLPDYMDICTGPKYLDNSAVLSYLVTQEKLDFPTGSKFEYSNTGYSLLALIIERAAGVSYPNFLASRIFQPLGMARTTVMTPENFSNIPERATGYSGLADNYELNDDDPCNYIYGDGGVYTNPPDYFKWTQNIEHSKLLNSPNATRLLAPDKLNSGAPNDYAYGWINGQTFGHATIWHSGGWLGFANNSVFIPSQDLWMVLFSNYENYPIYEITDDILEEVLGEFLN